MKFSKYFMMAGAAFMLAACSSEEPIGQAPVDEGLETTPVFATFNIRMEPSDGTRATTLVDGDASEYAITNGQVLIFGVPNSVWTGTDATKIPLDKRIQAKFIVAAQLDMESMEKDETNANGISSTYKQVKAKFAKGTFSSSNYSAYLAVCMLNYKPDGKFMPSAGDTYSEWASNATDGDYTYTASDGKTYYKMTNAPSYSNHNHYVMEVVDRTKIEEYEADLTDVAASFTVQRMAAKVTLANNADQEFTVAENTTYAGDKAVLKAWAMDITSKKCFPVQNVWTSNNRLKEFIDYEQNNSNVTWVHANDRCNWAFGYNYNKEYKEGFSADDFNTCSANFNTFSTNPAYMRENMVAYDRMTKGNCTRMVVKAEYTLAGGAKDFIKIQNVATLYTVPAFEDLVKEKCEESWDVETVEIESAAGMYDFKTAVTLKKTDGTVINDPNILKILAERCGIYHYEDAEISVYNDGICYYPIYIKHFAEFQEAANPAIVADNINYLTDYGIEHTGRYGVVRNNWYDVNINSISGPGYPIIPPRPTEEPVDGPTDTTNKFLQVNIQIMKWTKHTQDVDL